MSQIKATIVADSVSSVNGQRITTFELEYPRWIHGEILTHRLFSRNAMSSRAVPVEKMLDQIIDNFAAPTHWGKNQPGMQAKEELTGKDLHNAKIHWEWAVSKAVEYARYLSEDGAHKQIVNRILEPFQLMKTVLTATEFDNFFWLRCHEDAQPEIRQLAYLMWEALQASKPIELKPGDWHVPYFDHYGTKGVWHPEYDKVEGMGGGYTLSEALAVSSSCCAQVSYRMLDDSIEKARKVYQRLVESTPVHASPFEHCATPIMVPDLYCHDCQCPPTWEDGVTHVDKESKFWSGNFKSWIQYRQLIDGNVCNKFEEKTHETS